jgi:choline monooxygenase
MTLVQPSLIDPDISRAWTLPASFYLDPAIAAQEKDKIFSRTWQVVGHHDQVSNSGDYFTTQFAGEPLLIVRGGDHQLRAFFNVCRHRAGPPAEGCGSRKLFRCVYHGWTYNLDGSLNHATEIEGVEGFKPEDFALAPVRCAEWFHLVFVNLDANAPPLLDSLGQLPTQAERFQFQTTKLLERRTYARHVRQWSPIRGAQPGDTTPRRYQEAREGLTTDYFWAFPNWMLNCYPDNVSLNIVLPMEPERSLAIFEWYLPEEDLGSEAAKASVRFSDEIQHEDMAICEAVQKNLHSRSYQRGRFSVKQEKSVHAFHRMYAQAMST